MDSPSTNSRELLERELDERIREDSWKTSLNGSLSFIIVGLTALLSFGAFVMSLLEAPNARMIGMLAGVAALLTTLNAIYKFELRAKWFHTRASGLRRLRRKLQFPRSGEPDIPALAEELSDLLDTLAAERPSLGGVEYRPPGTTKGAS